MVNYRTMLTRRHRFVAVGMALLLILTLVMIVPAANVQGSPYPSTEESRLLSPTNEDLAQAYPATIEWEDAPQRANNEDSFHPWIAVDSNDNSHIVYVADNGRLRYMNDVNGSFGDTQELARGLDGNRDPFIAIAAGPNNLLHVAYVTVGSGNNVLYRRGTPDGANVNWGNAIQLSAGSKSFGAHVTVDNSGDAHVVWIEDRCGEYEVFHREVFADGNVSGITSPIGGCRFHNRPQVAVTDDGKAHVVVQRDGRAEIFYARYDQGGWVSQNISDTGGTNSLNPTITTDGENLYVAWGEGISSGNHDVLFRRSTDGGENWSNTIAMSDGPGFASFPSLTWSESAQRAYIAWSDDAVNNREIWVREFDPSNGRTTEADKLTNLNDESTLPTISAGPTRVDTSWQDKVDGPRQVYRWRGTTAESTCNGALVLNGGEEATRGTSVTAAITPDNCQPNQMKLSVDDPITEDTPLEAYQASRAVAMPSADVCERTVYGQLFVDGRGGDTFSDTIVVDPAVTAQVSVRNPYLPGQPPVLDDDGRALDGDPNYTRVRQARLNISGATDCSGLSAFSMPGITTQAITNNAYRDLVRLPGNEAQGAKTFQVSVTDGIGNDDLFPSASTSFNMIYDTTVPVLDTEEFSPTVTGPVSATSILVDLSFAEIAVDDNLYGQRENLPAGREYWGIWVANSRTADVADSDLSWTAVRVQPGTSFTAEWNLFNGLGYGASPNNRQGEYYVHVKFLDGAGNPSAETLRSPVINLQPGYSLIETNLPLVRR
ncbi:MAG: hypothetical protein GFH27_549313n52 [Chloroflexi bacterium AL-W]|nr:hypothetical protein [Chloroflexi bacterium AL-W]